MGKKYIIEQNDECNSEFKGIMVFGLTQEKQISVELIPEESLTPYTEDSAYAHGYTEAESKYREIRDELETQAYQKCLSDAWEAARKLQEIDMNTIHEIFGWVARKRDVFITYTASEVIEKIRQYEQKKQEFHVGDEFENGSGKRFVILKMDGAEIDRYIDEEGKTYCMSQKYKVMRKTGRHFPEIATVLEKMKEGKEQ